MPNETERGKENNHSGVSCAANIEKGLSKLPGVSRVNVNLASEKASIEYDPSKVDTKTLMDTISDVGYGLAVG